MRKSGFPGLTHFITPKERTHLWNTTHNFWTGETFTLAIGGQTEDGSYVYAALEAPAPGCDLFLISADKARTLSDLNYESLSADEEAE